MEDGPALRGPRLAAPRCSPSATRLRWRYRWFLLAHRVLATHGPTRAFVVRALIRTTPLNRRSLCSPRLHTKIGPYCVGRMAQWFDAPCTGPVQGAFVSQGGWRLSYPFPPHLFTGQVFSHLFLSTQPVSRLQRRRGSGQRTGWMSRAGHRPFHAYLPGVDRNLRLRQRTCAHAFV